MEVYMNNKILEADQISTVTPSWQHPVLPGHAVQGSILYTISDFVNPPQSQEMFKWIPMEQLVGVHDVRFKYYEQDNTYHIYKTYGHLNNDGSWTEESYDIGHFNALTDEVKKSLMALTYVDYKYTFTDNTLTITGKNIETGTYDTLLTVKIPSMEAFDAAVNDLNTKVTVEQTARITGDNNLQTSINQLSATVTDNYTELTNKLADETNNRVAADKTLTDNLNTEVTNRTNDITAVKSLINTERLTRTDDITKLQNVVNTEIAARTNADTTLQNNINAKQDKLTAGTNITIVDNVISATGGGSDETENWTFTLSDGSTITRTVLINTTTYENWTFTLSDGSAYTRNVGIKEA